MNLSEYLQQQQQHCFDIPGSHSGFAVDLSILRRNDVFLMFIGPCIIAIVDE